MTELEEEREAVSSHGSPVQGKEEGLRFLHFFVFLIRPVLVVEKATEPHSSTLAWKIPWTEEPGRLQSMGSLSRT